MTASILITLMIDMRINRRQDLSKELALVVQTLIVFVVMIFDTWLVTANFAKDANTIVVGQPAQCNVCRSFSSSASDEINKTVLRRTAISNSHHRDHHHHASTW